MPPQRHLAHAYPQCEHLSATPVQPHPATAAEKEQHWPEGQVLGGREEGVDLGIRPPGGAAQFDGGWQLGDDGGDEIQEALDFRAQLALIAADGPKFGLDAGDDLLDRIGQGLGPLALKLPRPDAPA